MKRDEALTKVAMERNFMGIGMVVGDHEFMPDEINAERVRLINKPDWKDAPEWAQWMAQDEDGEWKWYSVAPHQFCDSYGSTPYLIAADGQIPAGHDWRQTLERRPGDWPTDKRIDAIGQNGPTGDHYGEPPSKYHVPLNGQFIDVYDVLWAFGITNPGDQHALKKMLMPGKRGHKDAEQDRREAILSLERAIALEARP